MKLSKGLISLLAGVALAHTQNDQNLEDTDLSLPDLATLDALNPPKWEISGSAEFQEGRIILTPTPGSLGVLKNPIPVAYDSWTLETIFRAMGATGKTGSIFTLKYTAESTDAVYGAFDGLEIVVDADGDLGGSVHAYLNDGSVDMAKLKPEERYEHAFGSCLLSYQDTSVPTTLRVAYYAGNLVVQVNNRVCIKTQQVKLPQDYKVSLLAISGFQHEVFELLKLKTYGGVISEVADNDGSTAPQPKIVTEYIRTDNEGHVLGTEQVESKPEETVKKPEEERIKFDSDVLSIIENVQKSNKEMLDSFSSMESKIVALSGKGGSVDFSLLDEQNKKLKQLSSQISAVSDQVKALEGKFSSLESTVVKEIGKVVASVNKLNADNINELRENEHSLNELTRKVEYLVLSEKEKEQNPVNELINGLKYLILPILVVSIALCFFAYRLRHDIKTKLL